jgi:hypothetical protein
MMPGFRRAQLKGSDEVFRATDEAGRTPEPAQVVEAAPISHPVPTAPAPDLRSVRLTEGEIEVLVEAVQHLKFPGKHPVRPSVDDFERLEELRQKLISAI